MSEFEFINKRLNTIRPNVLLRRLQVLRLLSDQPALSQHKLAEQVDACSATVNKFVRGMVAEGLLTKQGATNRSMSYHVTDQGEAYLRAMITEFSTEVVQLYGAIKREIARVLRRLRQEGVKRLALFGAAETAEVTLAAIEDFPFELVAIVDNDPRKQGAAFGKYRIQAPEALHTLIMDAILITSFAGAEAIAAQLAPMTRRGVRVVPLAQLPSAPAGNKPPTEP